MKYPDFLKKNDIIGICAPSDGIGSDVPKCRRLESAKECFENRGYRTLETQSVRKSVAGRSANAAIRASEFMELIENPDCKAIIAAGGGDWLFEMLPYLDYRKIAEHPTWFEGMSDPTGICYTMTVLADIASVYGTNVGAFGMRPLDESLENNLKILEGESIVQKNGDSYQSEWLDLETGLEVYKKDSKTEIKRLDDPGEDCDFSGRLLGGCMDVLVQLCGTRFDGTKKFIEKYKKDGTIWFLEVFSMTPEVLASYLWKFKEAGWFDNVRGFLFGRPTYINTDFSQTTYEEAIMTVLGSLGRPVITGLDIGHRPPTMTIVNGSVGKAVYRDGEFELGMRFC